MNEGVSENPSIQSNIHVLFRTRVPYVNIGQFLFLYIYYYYYVIR